RPRRGPPSRDHEVFEDCTPPLAETCRPKAGSASPTCRGPGASYTAAVLPGPRTPLAAAVTAIALAASPGCDDEPRAIDPFPVRFDPSAGPVMVGVDDGDGPRPAVIDTLAAITLLDPLAAGRDAGEARRRRVTLTLLGLDDAGQ